MNERRQSLTKIAQKWIDVKCKICGCQAIGYNYQVLTCASCKTFFRRNLHRNLVCYSNQFEKEKNKRILCL